MSDNEERVIPNNTCTICDNEIVVMAFRGTGVCCDEHRKERDGDVPHGMAARMGQTDAGVTHAVRATLGSDGTVRPTTIR